MVKYIVSIYVIVGRFDLYLKYFEKEFSDLKRAKEFYDEYFVIQPEHKMNKHKKQLTAVLSFKSKTNNKTNIIKETEYDLSISRKMKIEKIMTRLASS